MLFPTESDWLAYWINAYNATAMVTVLHYHPIKSVSDVRAPVLLRWLQARSGFFIFQQSTYGGAKMNLYYLEHGVIRFPRAP